MSAKAIMKPFGFDAALAIEWLPSVDGTPNLLEQIRVFPEIFSSESNQLDQNAGANLHLRRPFRRRGFAPFAS
jgi:hypothetical protein